MSVLTKENRAQWPERLDEIAGVIGDDATIALFEHYRGRHVCVPMQPTDALIQAIGRDAAAALCRTYHNEILVIPTCAQLQRTERNRRIIADYQSGVPVCEIATRYNMTTRQISHITKPCRQEKTT